MNPHDTTRTVSLLGLRMLAHAVEELYPEARKLPEREGTVEDDRGPLVLVRFADMTAELRFREDVTILDTDEYARRVTAATMGAARDPLLPAWGKHQRMGFTVLYGYVEPYGDGTARLTVPAIDGDDARLPSPEQIHIVPMGGPAFFGFQRMTEDEVRAEVARNRQRKPRALTVIESGRPPAMVAPAGSPTVTNPPAPEVGQRIDVCFLRRPGANGQIDSIAGDFEVTAVGDGGAPIEIVRIALMSNEPDPDLLRLSLTPAEWKSCVFGVASPDGQSIYSEIPF